MQKFPDHFSQAWSSKPWFEPCILKAKTGSWEVYVRPGSRSNREQDCLVFTRGWTQFVEDNLLNESDLLTFHMDEFEIYPQTFWVTVYSQSNRCEKP